MWQSAKRLGHCFKKSPRESQNKIAKMSPSSGTSIATSGNAIVVRENDPAVYFADHTWYDDDLISYEDLAGDGEWIELPLTDENVKRSLFKLAGSSVEFRSLAERGDLERVIDSID